MIQVEKIRRDDIGYKIISCGFHTTAQQAVQEVEEVWRWVQRHKGNKSVVRYNGDGDCDPDYFILIFDLQLKALFALEWYHGDLQVRS